MKILNIVMKRVDKKMNIVIIYGKIVSEIDFKFIYNRYVKDSEMENKISIAKCKMELTNGSIVEIYGYDEIADLMYKNLKKECSMYVEGRMNSNGKIMIYSYCSFNIV